MSINIPRSIYKCSNIYKCIKRRWISNSINNTNNIDNKNIDNTTNTNSITKSTTNKTTYRTPKYKYDRPSTPPSPSSAEEIDIFTEEIGYKLTLIDVNKKLNIYSLDQDEISIISYITGNFSNGINLFIDILKNQKLYNKELFIKHTDNKIDNVDYKTVVVESLLDDLTKLSKIQPNKTIRSNNGEEINLKRIDPEILKLYPNSYDHPHNQVSNLDSISTTLGNILNMKGSRTNDMIKVLLKNRISYDYLYLTTIPLLDKKPDIESFYNMSLSILYFNEIEEKKWLKVWECVFDTLQNDESSNDMFYRFLANYLLQLVPANNLTVDPEIIVPVSFADDVLNSESIKSIKNPFIFSGCAGESVAALLIEGNLIKVSPDGLSWMCVTPACEAALLKLYKLKFESILKWMLSRKEVGWHEIAFKLSFINSSNVENPVNIPLTSVTGYTITKHEKPFISLKWNKFERLTWRHLSQTFSLHNPLYIEKETLYVLPPLFPYPCFLLSNNQDRVLIITASFLDYSSSELNAEFAYRLARPLTLFGKTLPPYLNPLTPQNSIVAAIGDFIDSRPTVGEFIRTFSRMRDLRVIKADFENLEFLHLHITPSTTTTDLDSDLNTCVICNQDDSSFDELFGSSAKSIKDSFEEWKNTYSPPKHVEITLESNLAMLKRAIKKINK